MVGPPGQKCGHQPTQAAESDAGDDGGLASPAGDGKCQPSKASFHQVKDIELDVVHGRQEPRNVPMMIGATGPKMMELTGEIADGAVLNYCVPPDYNHMAAGAA